MAEETVRAEEVEWQCLGAPGAVRWAAAGQPASHVGAPLSAGDHAHRACAAASDRPRHKTTGGDALIAQSRAAPGSYRNTC